MVGTLPILVVSHQIYVTSFFWSFDYGFSKFE